MLSIKNFYRIFKTSLQIHIKDIIIININSNTHIFAETYGSRYMSVSDLKPNVKIYSIIIS